jgi:hypothetical protein
MFIFGHEGIHIGKGRLERYRAERLASIFQLKERMYGYRGVGAGFLRVHQIHMSSVGVALGRQGGRSFERPMAPHPEPRGVGLDWNSLASKRYLALPLKNRCMTKPSWIPDARRLVVY